jgi:nitrite reductase/ring-hydroxylating ferredoxin subunit/uncharacterized membrane protein
MRSRASVKGHPIHPALIPFPFAFLTGALAFDLLGWLFATPAWWNTGEHLVVAGVLSALVAAVPGVIDYIYTVPPNSSGKQRATRHMLTNLSAVTLMGAAWVVRQSASPEMLVVGLEFIAVGLLSYGSLLGGVLVSRNQISIDHRYADAGKWKEATFADRPGAPVTVASIDELEPNQMKLLRFGDRRIVLARTEDTHVAFDDRCTHRGGSLAGGMMSCETVHCPWHGSQFDVRSGAVKTGPANEPIRTYTVETRGRDVILSLEQPVPPR